MAAPREPLKQIIAAHVKLDTAVRQMQLDKQQLAAAELRMKCIHDRTPSHLDLAAQDAIAYLQDSHRHQKAKYEDAVDHVSRALQEAAQAMGGGSPASPPRAASIAALASQAAAECPQLAKNVALLFPAPPPPPSEVIDLTNDE